MYFALAAIDSLFVLCDFKSNHSTNEFFSWRLHVCQAVFSVLNNDPECYIVNQYPLTRAKGAGRCSGCLLVFPCFMVSHFITPLHCAAIFVILPGRYCNLFLLEHNFNNFNIFFFFSFRYKTSPFKMVYNLHKFVGLRL